MNAFKGSVQLVQLPTRPRRADIIRQAIEYYLDEIEDLRCGLAVLKVPADPVLNWAEVRDALLAADAGRMLVVEAIDLLYDTPAAGSALKGEFEGLRRFRAGHFRVVYEWQRSELVILVVRIGHGREVYR